MRSPFQHLPFRSGRPKVRLIGHAFWATFASCAVLTGCGTVVSHHDTQPGTLGKQFDGLYETTWTLPALGGTYSGLIASKSEGGAFRANSRPGVVSKSVGGVRGLLAEWFGGRAMRGGAFIHWTGDVHTTSGRLTGELLTPFGRMRTEGDFSTGEVELYQSRTDERLGSLRLESAGGAGNTGSDFRILNTEIRDALSAHLYDPDLMQDRGLRRFLGRIEWVSTWARDDLEYAFAFFVAARDLPFSHVGLERPNKDQQNRETGEQLPPRVTVIDGGGALLRIPSFAVDVSAIDGAFEKIASINPDSLVIDLRDNVGGTYVSLRVASYLLEKETIVGALFRGSAREDVLAGKWEAFPRVSRVESITALDRMLDEHGAVVGVARPAASSSYRGPVIVLTNDRTASACEPIVELLKRTGRALIVGETTAGAMLSSRRFELGQGWRLVLPAADYVTAEGLRLEGRGVTPDIHATSGDALGTAIQRLNSPPIAVVTARSPTP